MTFIIGFYEIDRSYGGSEEGGWFYDTGVLDRPFRIVRSTSDERAYAIARRANHLIRFIQSKNRGLRDVGSVIYNGGRYSAFVFEDTLPKFFPEERPHYE